jgi:hypothetical protein
MFCSNSRYASEANHPPSATTVKLVYGKFIEVWRANEKSVLNTKMKRILLLNASHEGSLTAHVFCILLTLYASTNPSQRYHQLSRSSHGKSTGL